MPTLHRECSLIPQIYTRPYLDEEPTLDLEVLNYLFIIDLCILLIDSPFGQKNHIVIFDHY